MAISTKNIPASGSGVAKIIQPGNQVIKINSVVLEKVSFKEGGYQVILNTEGPDLGSGFDGFNIDKNDPSKGKYTGQIGKIKSSQYAYSDQTIKNKAGEEIKIERDKEMLKFLANFCKDTGLGVWFDKQDEKHETIEELFEQFNIDKPFANKWFRVCVAGKEYTNNQGYLNYDLFLPKSTSKQVAAESDLVPQAESRLIKFNEKLHVIQGKKSTPVESFGEDKALKPTKKNTDFSLD